MRPSMSFGSKQIGNRVDTLLEVGYLYPRGLEKDQCAFVQLYVLCKLQYFHKYDNDYIKLTL